MELPKSVKVGAWTYRIEEWPTRRAAADGKYGETDHAGSQILIDTGYGRQRATTTLLHELLHCVWRVWCSTDEDSHERTVTIFEEGLAAVWRDNPDVMAWIHRGLTAEGGGEGGAG